MSANFHKIQSRDNQKLKYARAVRDGNERQSVFVEGLRLCEEILKTDLQIKTVFLSTEFLKKSFGQSFIQNLISRNLDINETEQKAFNSLSDTKNSQGVVVIAEKPFTGKEIIERNLSSNALLLLLHKINNPSNLGAILRTAEAAGVKGVITTKGSTDAFSPKALRGAMGAAFRLPFWANVDFFETLKWAKEKKIKSVCADINSRQSYAEIEWNEPKLLIFGSEGHGLSESEMNAADESLLIPMENEVESLNVAVACGIVLFEAKRQKKSI